MVVPFPAEFVGSNKAAAQSQGAVGERWSWGEKSVQE